MSKQRNADISGFVHAVSPQKKNKSFYFKIQVDGNDSVKKGICFDSEKFGVFKKQNMSGEPLKITNAIIQQQSFSGTHR